MLNCYVFLDKVYKVPPKRNKYFIDGYLTIIKTEKGEEDITSGCSIPFRMLKRTSQHRLVTGIVLYVYADFQINKNKDILCIYDWRINHTGNTKKLLASTGINIVEERSKTTNEGYFLSNGDEKELLDVYSNDVYAVEDIFRRTGINYDIDTAWSVVDYFNQRARRRGFDSVSEMIEYNPYVLNEIDDLPNDIGSHIAKAWNFSIDDTSMLYTNIVKILTRETAKGNTFIPIAHIATKLSKDIEKIKKTTDKSKKTVVSRVAMMGKKDIVRRSIADISISSDCKDSTVEFYKNEYINQNIKTNLFDFYTKEAGTGLYMVASYFSEKNGAKLFSERIGKDPLKDILEYFDKEKNNGIYNHLDENQLQAIENALNYKVSIISGQPGSGKTHTIGEIVNLFNRHSSRSVVLASSAIAATNAGQRAGLTEENYQTIHRFSKIAKQEDLGISIQKKENEKITDYSTINMIIVDEMSMCNICTFYKFLHTIKKFPDIHLVLVGDIEQLPAIGPSGYFHQLVKGAISSEILPTVNLCNIYRMNKDNDLLPFILSLRNNKRFPEKEYSSVEILSRDISNILDVIKNLLAKNINFDDILVLTDKNVGELGTIKLNKIIRDYFIGHDAMEIDDTSFCVGDPIVAISNDYYTNLSNNNFLTKIRHSERNRDIYNGTRGIIKSFDPEKQTVEVLYKDNLMEYIVPYTIKELTIWISLAYALTVHKAQGAEAKYVLFVTADKKGTSFSSNLLYTAITRAKEKVFLFGEKDLWKSIATKFSLCPYTRFAQLVNSHLEKDNWKGSRFSNKITLDL